METSAKTGENITECMTRLLDSVIVFDDIWEVEMTGRYIGMKILGR